MDRHTLYELCVQSPDDLVPLLRAIHGRSPLVLGEDFCGTGRVGAAWVGQVAGGRAVAVDLDAEAASRVPPHGSIEAVVGDVLRDTDVQRHRADVIWVGNFSIGEHRTRRRSARVPASRATAAAAGGRSRLRSLRRRDGVPDRPRRPRSSAARRTRGSLHVGAARGGSADGARRQRHALRGALRGQRRAAAARRVRLPLAAVGRPRAAGRDAGGRLCVDHGLPATPDAVDDEGRAWVDPLEDPVELEDSFDVLIACAAAPTANTTRTHHP